MVSALLELSAGTSSPCFSMPRILRACARAKLLLSTLCDPKTVAHQAPLSMGFSRQEYWSGLPFPSSGDLPDPGIEPTSPALQADFSLAEPPVRGRNWDPNARPDLGI